MKIEYIEKNLLGNWRIEVRKNKIHVGNIRNNPTTAAHQYFKGPYNELNYSFEKPDLEALKKRIES